MDSAVTLAVPPQLSGSPWNRTKTVWSWEQKGHAHLSEDSARCELILSIRGTMSLSDLFADLIGDTEPFAGISEFFL